MIESINFDILLKTLALSSKESFIIGSEIYEFIKIGSINTDLYTSDYDLYHCATFNYDNVPNQNILPVNVYFDKYLDSKSIIIDGRLVDLSSNEFFKEYTLDDIFGISKDNKYDLNELRNNQWNRKDGN